MTSFKSIAMMSPALLEKFQLFRVKMEKAGIAFMITSVARSVLEQAALYSQGRNPLSVVNRMRKVADLPPIKSAENNKVTWTLHSKHLIDLDDGVEENNWSRAFDIAILTDKKTASWNIKVDVNKNQEPDYLEAAKIGKSVGLIPGAYFKNAKGESRPDYPHYEV